ncbi:class I SAM-dependent methyltransferase [Corynebacterium sanguinis]|uniref:class I SAM-dependent methyltransferase n=1 Tax=Corynebacterium sanguinis TaxID=2594913 RepID=UPI00223ACE62|nr:class I SAM-dependent methyltransferase [Corynebacterium sanguinis]MCT1628791.1 class I SAM-dependent methyltransferase [Corynebacterium sanguinis]
MKPSRKESPTFRDAAHRSAAAHAFSQGAALYDDVRPSYPPAIAGLVSTPATVADIGCGTGKLTETLLGPDRRVFACDPSADMVRVFAARLPEVPVWRATAEATALADASVDALTCAQTWHWVDAHAASREADRVIAPGGELLLCWNTLDVRHPWVLRLSRIMHSGDVQRDGFYPEVAAPWTLAREHRETWLMPMDTDGLFELMATRSYWLRASAATREKMRANLSWYLFERLGFDPGQVLPIPYRTDAFVYRRPG